MLTEVYSKGGSNRFATEGRTRRGTSVIPDVPVMTLVSDILLHSDIFEDIVPDVFVYNTVSRGGADVEDPTRDSDRIQTHDEVTLLEPGLENLAIDEVPRYAEMVKYLCESNGYQPEEFRVHRLRVQYPIFGFQYVIAYKVPEKS
jgi:hypothetical protein